MKTAHDIVQAYRNGEKMDFLFFWGHQPSKTGEITKSCLSQWWMQDFEEKGDAYCCAEQYMMAKKAKIFGDYQTEKAIMVSRNPKVIKALGRTVRGFNQKTWDENKRNIVFNGNWLKFSQNKNLMDFLLSTGEKVIVEASPYDRVWGIGMSANNTNVMRPDLWEGENLLGFVLMDVRKMLEGNE